MDAAARPAVRYGRRKGQRREPTPLASWRHASRFLEPVSPLTRVYIGVTTEINEVTAANGLEEYNVPDSIFLPNGVDLHQVTVLPKAEWVRIRDSVDSAARETARIHAERKEWKDMHLRSKAIVKNWPNTIAGQAQRKLKAKKLREEKEEEERKLLDLEEAQFQAAKRKEAIEQAKTYQYFQNERVKGLHKALLLTEVLKERDAQIEFKKTKPDIYKKKEEEMEREHEKAILKEQEKAYERYMNRQALCRDHLEQIKEHKHQAELDKLEAKKEGKEIQRLTKLYELEVQKENEKKLEEKLEHRRMHCAHVADQDILKAVQEQKQEEENDKIRAHFKAKQNMNKLRREKEAEMNRLMQERRDITINRLVEQMKQTFERIDERVARDVAEREAEWEKELKEKEEKNKAELKSIAEHRATVIKMKGEREREARLEGKEKLHELMEADRIYLEMEKDKKRRNRNENIKMQETHIQQMAEKRAKEQHEKQAELNYEAQKEVIAICKEQEFQEYANQVIDSESKTARNIYPLLKAAKEGAGGGHGPVYKERGGIRPSYQARDINGTQLPSYNCNTTEVKELNTNGNIQQTKGRLGFTW
ncbi:coiled-coil domain-containing protein 173 isoform X3 [Dermochelys coriacea]|uniref:coiled-coil domain-containing protein 173 isoform X3 n=1 Tax=Dermochelys coriacea TaxID=27794 RepID=UPI0018E8A8A5|nr:coiled-coil domain-containing protein 173 isoform X3 [Dermochelys coriacea]